MSDTTILIVEDEAISAMNLQNWFEFWGYNAPILACSEKTALEKVQGIKLDLALINIGFENSNNRITFAKKITDSFDTAIVYVTSHFNDEVMQHMRSTKPYGFISKPFDENQLKYTVENALYKRRIHKRFIASK
ncbi:MAG TPA: response regulator [Methanobacterium sp.]|nr:response regulator [Methanobacterium sp.]